MRRTSTDGSSAEPATPVSRLRGELASEFNSASAVFNSLQSRVTGLEESQQAIRQELGKMGASFQASMASVHQTLQALVLNSSTPPRPVPDDASPMASDVPGERLAPAAPFVLPGVTMEVLDVLLTTAVKPSTPLLHTPNSRFDRTALPGGNAVYARPLEMGHHPDYVRLLGNPSLGRAAALEFQFGYSAASWLLDTLGGLVAFRAHVAEAHLSVFDELLRHFAEAFAVLSGRLGYLQTFGQHGLERARALQALSRGPETLLDSRFALHNNQVVASIHKHAAQENFAAFLRGGSSSGGSRGRGSLASVGGASKSAAPGSTVAPSAPKVPAPTGAPRPKRGPSGST